MLSNVYLLLFIFIVCWYFIYMRQVAEAGRKHGIRYCQMNKLQFISIARRKVV